MANIITENKEEPKEPVKRAVKTITLIALMLLCILTIAGIALLWPSSSLDKLNGAFGFRYIDTEQRFLFLVALGGVLGAFVHISTSFVVFWGNDKLLNSWLPWYFMRPFIGAAIALVFYLLIRGGIVSYQPMVNQLDKPANDSASTNVVQKKPVKDTVSVAAANKPIGKDSVRTDKVDTSKAKTIAAITASQQEFKSGDKLNPSPKPEPQLPFNPFGIMAIACLAGMFSKHATDKLEEVFKAMFPLKGTPVELKDKADK